MVSEKSSQLERLTFFSDAVFAIAITLLVIDIHPARLTQGPFTAQLNELLQQTPQFLGFVLSFLVIGALWILHHRVFGLLIRHDDKLLWPNLFGLMGIVFTPFATALMSENPNSPLAEAFYALTLLVTGLLQRWMVGRALRPANLPADLPASVVSAYRWRAWSLPVAASLSLILAFIVPPLNNLAFAAVPLLVRIFKRWGETHAGDAGAESAQA